MTGRTECVRTALSMVVLVALSACSGQRPIEVIRQNADHQLALGHYEAAAGEYGAIVDRAGGDWEAQYGLGLCCLELGRLPEARRALEIAHTRRPQDDRIVQALAETMYRQGEEHLLFAFLRQQAETTQSVGSYLRLARYVMALGDADSAKIALETAIELDQGQAVEPYLDAASFAQRVGDLNLAIRRLRQAYGVDPRDRRVNERLLALGEVPGPTIALPPGR